MKSFMKEFKEFAMRGNVMDMAIGIIIGSAFTAIVTSLVDDVISPFIGIFFKMDFSDLSANVRGSEIMYGKFIMAVVSFIIIALVLFAMIKAMNRLTSIGKTAEAEEEAPTVKTCPYCKSEIAIDATRCPNCTSELE